MLQRHVFALLAFGLLMSSASWANVPPVISGSPPTTAVVNTVYSFQPKATDANWNTLYFSINNKPSWATFNTSTGLLTGKPITAGTYYSIEIGVTDGMTSRVWLPKFNVVVGGNSAPTLSGTPATSVTTGSTYYFKPTATDANADVLGFSIQNKPIWAGFNTSTGVLSGAPTTAQVGSYANIIVRVTDGKVTTSLPAFSITVKTATTAAIASSGKALLSWMPPLINIDGSTLTNLAGYRIYYGSSAAALTNSVKVSLGFTSHMIENLAAGTWYFAISSINSAGVESTRSSVITKKL